jgi:hypothetical protein
VQELSPFGGSIDELKDEWTTGDDTGTARQKIPAKR